MIKMTYNTVQFRNKQSPFTELFSLLKRYELLPQGKLTLAYHTKELKVMNKHLRNAKTIVTQGLEDMFNLLGNAESSDATITPTSSMLWTFLGALMNLRDALDTLQSDASYVLQQRKSA